MLYTYAILRENSNDARLSQINTLIPCNHKKTKYALIEKAIMQDRSEIVVRVIYSNDINELSNALKKYISWYNEPLGLQKDMQQNISEY